MLVLLIIFMLTANPIAARAIKVELPEAATGDGVAPATVGVTLAKSGAMYVIDVVRRQGIAKFALNIEPREEAAP